MKRSPVLLMIGLLLLVAVAGWLGGTAYAPIKAREAAMAQRASSSSPSVARASADAEDRRATKPRVAAASTAPLPEANVSLAIALPELRRRADAGDARAQCRLAFELIRCAAYTTRHDDVEQWLRRREAEQEAITAFDARGLANAVAEQQIQLAGRAKQCAVVPEADIASADDLLYRAAMAGNLEATLRYIDGQGFGMVGRAVPMLHSDMGYLQHPGFERWRREAPRLAQALLRAGEPAVLFQLHDAYLNDESPFAALIPDDPARAAAIFQFERHRIGLPPVDIPNLTPQQRAASEVILHEMQSGPLRNVGADAKAVGAAMHPAYSFAPNDTAACE